MTYIALRNENLSISLLKENEINYQVLDELFYKGMRNALTEKKLEINAELAKTIKEPKIFGKFDSDVEYLKIVDFFINSTLETRHIAEKQWMTIIKKVYNAIKKWGIGHCFKRGRR